jgi:Ca2+-binding RTX toxin-like protein
MNGGSANPTNDMSASGKLSGAGGDLYFLCSGTGPCSCAHQSDRAGSGGGGLFAEGWVGTPEAYSTPLAQGDGAQPDTGTLEPAQGALPVFSTSQIVDQLSNGFWSWSGRSARSWGITNISYNVSNMSSARATLARLALASWSDVANLTFTETSFATSVLDFFGTGSGASSSSTVVNGLITYSQILLSPAWFNFNSSVDSYTYETLIHEVGHSLGLGHGGNYNFTDPVKIYENDTTQQTVMSYFRQNTYNNASDDFVFTPQMADIAAVQAKYGAASTRTGSTRYGFNVSGLTGLTAQLYNFSNYVNAPSLTIYDSGGSDTLDVSGYSVAQRIDLRPGNFSDIGGLRGNIGIYTTTFIENAVSGGGGDLIWGNSTDNFLAGNAGNDQFFGDGGSDIIDGGTDFDVVDYSASFAAIQINMTTNANVGGDAQGDSYANIEAIRGSGFDDIMTGNSIGNQLYGQDGNDILNGGSGGDYLDGGTGTDTADYSTSAAAVTVNLTTNVNVGGDAQGDALVGIEAVAGSAFNDLITGDGGSNSLFGGGGGDQLYGQGGTDTLFGGAGADLLDGGAGFDGADYSASLSAVQVNAATNVNIGGDAQGDTLLNIEYVRGSVFDDTLTATSGSDQLYGQAGNDTLNGGASGDYLDGGAGFDMAVYWNSSTGVHVNLATNTNAGGDAQGDFVVGFEAVSGSSFDDNLTGDAGANYLFGGSGNDTLIGGAEFDYLDGGAGSDSADYSASAAAIQVNLTTGVNTGGDAQGDTLLGVETVVGSTFNDVIVGDGNANTLTGGGGSDQLIGGGGADLLDGGTGFDGAEYETSAAAVTVNLATNVNTGGDAQGDTLANIEYVRGSAFDDGLTGSSGSDQLYGQAGNDTLNGGAGGDYIDGGAGTDIVDYSTSSAAVQVNLSSGTFSGGDAQGDFLVGIEAVTATAFNDTIAGDGNANTIRGGAGGDQLFGFAGDDTLDGGAGGDYLDGGVGFDGADYSASTAAVQVNLTTNANTGGDAHGDVLVGFEFVRGSAFNDTLTGSIGDDQLYGQGGNDTMNSSAGADFFDGGAGIDIADYSMSSGAVTVNLATNVNSGGHAQSDSLNNVETVVGSAFGDIIIGDGNANTLMGGNGSDQLVGGAGADVLDGNAGFDGADYSSSAAAVTVNLTTNVNTGGDAQGDSLANIEYVRGSVFGDNLTATSGNDQLYGQAGNDTLNGGAGGDYIDGGAGSDTIDYSASSAAVQVDLSSGTFSGGDAQGDFLVGIEAVTGTAFNDTISGDGNANTMRGGAGGDQLFGLAGNDMLDGGAGGDYLDGGAGFDFVDYTQSSAGVSVDLLTNATSGGIAAGDVLVSIEALMGSHLDDTLSGTNAVDHLFGQNGDDTLIGRGAIDALFGGAGNDMIDGGDGDDYLDGSIGNDTIIGGAGVNTYAFGRGYGQDQIDNGSATDTGAHGKLSFQSGINRNQLWFAQSGNDLVATIIGTNDRATIANWYTQTTAQLASFETIDGFKLDAGINQLVAAMASFSASNPAFNPTLSATLPTDANLQAQLAASWHT